MLMRNPCECRKYPGTTIVTDSVTSNGLTQFIKDQGGKHFRYKRGYKNVISKGIELNDQGEDTNLMMETRCEFSATDLSMDGVSRTVRHEGDGACEASSCFEGLLLQHNMRVVGPNAWRSMYFSRGNSQQSCDRAIGVVITRTCVHGIL